MKLKNPKKVIFNLEKEQIEWLDTKKESRSSQIRKLIAEERKREARRRNNWKWEQQYLKVKMEL